MVTIVGAGLSGLLTGYRLKQAGIKVQILEARERIGGRIHTIYAQDGTPLEMGATWFGAQHKNLLGLLDELGLPYFEQFMKGSAYFQAMHSVPPEQFEIPAQEPSYRIVGGTRQIIEKLASYFEEDELLTGQEVSEVVEVQAPDVEALKAGGSEAEGSEAEGSEAEGSEAEGSSGQISEKEALMSISVRTKANRTFESDQVVLCLPPKLLSEKIIFSPALPSSFLEIARHTQTWMEDSIKVALVYRSPFWKERNLSGTLFSHTGPMTELYDHSNAEGTKFALCGFMHPGFKELNATQRQAFVVEQLNQIFGPEAGDYTGYSEMIWSREKFTSNPVQYTLAPHQNNGHKIYQTALFDGKVWFSGAESAPEYGGYMDGAVYSANTVAQEIIGF